MWDFSDWKFVSHLWNVCNIKCRNSKIVLIRNFKKSNITLTSFRFKSEYSLLNLIAESLSILLSSQGRYKSEILPIKTCIGPFDFLSSEDNQIRPKLIHVALIIPKILVQNSSKVSWSMGSYLGTVRWLFIELINCKSNLLKYI